MNRRSFMSMFGAGLTSVAVNPVHFLAPVGGWHGKRTYSFKDVSGPLVFGAPRPADVIWLCRTPGESDAQLRRRFSIEAETRRVAHPSVVEGRILYPQGLLSVPQELA